MENNPIELRSQEKTGNPINKVETQEKSKKEINPNSPTANQGEQNREKGNNQHFQNKTTTSILKTEEQKNESNPRNGNTLERAEEIREEEITDGIHGVTKPIKLAAEEEFTIQEGKEKTESKTDNLYIKKGAL